MTAGSKLKLLRVARNSYSQKIKRKEATGLALDYYIQSRGATGKLWEKLYNDGLVGKRVFKAITGYVHGLSGRCGYCQDPIFHKKNSNVDHILPSSIYPQFTFVEDNLVRACVTCNMLKLGDDYFALAAPVGSDYPQHSDAWACFHPRHHVFATHIERLVIQTNYLHFRAYFGKTPQGKKLCAALLNQVVEFEIKATANPVVAQAAQQLSQRIQSAGSAPQAAVKSLLKLFVAHI